MTRPIVKVYLAVLVLMMAGCGSADKAPSIALVTAPLINANTASEVELGAVPGLTDTAVAAIMAGRPFPTPSALHAAIGEGLSEDDQRSIYGALFIKVGLNTGAEEDYKLIPSTMSPGKLAHEFEEYRPYESMDQFRREMAKYVGDEEATYLVRYVTLD